MRSLSIYFFLFSVLSCSDATEPERALDSRPADPTFTNGQVVAFQGLTQNPDGTTETHAAVEIAFGSGHAPLWLNATNCAPPVVDGVCELSRCWPAFVHPVYPNVYTSAGTLHIKGASSGVSLSLVPMPSDRWYPSEYADGAWKPLEVLSLDATGHDVPPFTATTTFPAPITLLSPAEGAEIPTGSDLEVTWEPGQAEVDVALIGEHVGADPYCRGDDRCLSVAHCTFARSAGRAHLPSAMISDFAANKVSRFEIRPTHSSRAVVGTYDMSFVAIGDAAIRGVMVR